MTKTEKFIIKAREIHGNKYDYSLVNINTMTDRVDIICNIHGTFNQSAKIHIYSKSGCKQCGRDAAKVTCLKKYGVDNPQKSVDVRNKSKQTNLAKYGVEHPQQSSMIRDKSHQTNLKRYGVKHQLQRSDIQDKISQQYFDLYGCHVTQTDNFKDKAKQTCLEKYGTTHQWSNQEVRNKIKTTMLDKHGVEFASQSPTVQQKTNRTNLERYGHINIAQGILKEKIKQTNLERYGTANPFGNVDIQEKIKQTNLERYGTANPFGSVNIQEKIKQTNLERYGTTHHSQSHMVVELMMLLDYNYLYNEYIIRQKTAQVIARELGVTDVTIGNYLRKVEIEIRKFQQSYVSRCWLDSIMNINGINIVYEYQFDSSNKRLKADGYCQETNSIYEFHGDFWHGNPVIYNSTMIHPIIKKRTMGELYQKTIERENLIKSLGYNLIVIWESDYCTSIK